MCGHKLIPDAWKESTDNSRSGKPYLRSSITSRGPVSHGCSRMSPGHLSEFREMLPSTSGSMQGIRVFLNLSQCYDLYDIDGDGTDEAMGVQYYIAFQGKSRVADKIWAQNNRKDFYDWLYGDEIVYGEPGEVIVKAPYECEFVGRKAKLGPRHQNVRLYESPYEPEYLQFYTINGVEATTNILHMDEEFKPLRDATHNQISAALISRLAAYRDQLPRNRTEERQAISKLISKIDALTSLDQSALKPQLAEISDQSLRKSLQASLPAQNADVITIIDALAAMMVESRQAVASGKFKAADARRLVGLNVTAAVVIQSRGSELLDQSGATTVGQSLRLIRGLINSGYGVGLLSNRERLAALDDVDTLLDRNDRGRVEFLRRLMMVHSAIPRPSYMSTPSGSTSVPINPSTCATCAVPTLEYAAGPRPRSSANSNTCSRSTSRAALKDLHEPASRDDTGLADFLEGQHLVAI